MKSSIYVLAAIAVFAGSSAFADSQVVASPGVSLTEAAQIKFNRDTRPDDRHFAPVAGNTEQSPQFYAAAGLAPEEAQGWTLTQVYVAKLNLESGYDEQQRLPIDDQATSVSRAYGESANYAQLATAARLSHEEAAGMSWADLAEAKLNFEH